MNKKKLRKNRTHKKEVNKPMANELYIPNNLFGVTKLEVIKLYAHLRQRVLLNPSIKRSYGGEFHAFQLNNIYMLITAIKIYFTESPEHGSYYPYWVVETSMCSKSSGKFKQIKFDLLNTDNKNNMNIAQKLAIGECGIKADRIIENTSIVIGHHYPLSLEDIKLLPQVYQDLVRLK